MAKGFFLRERDEEAGGNDWLFQEWLAAVSFALLL